MYISLIMDHKQLTEHSKLKLHTYFKLCIKIAMICQAIAEKLLQS